MMARFRTVSALVAGLAALAALPSTPAHADGPVIDLGGAPPLSTLVRFAERDYRIDYDSSISLAPTSEARVTKIGYGIVTEVNVATTASGTYSSDGLTSPHVRYPGIRVTPEGEDRAFDIGLGWGPTPWRGYAPSFLTLHTSPDGDFIFADTPASGSVSCHLSGSFAHCFAR